MPILSYYKSNGLKTRDPGTPVTLPTHGMIIDGDVTLAGTGPTSVQAYLIALYAARGITLNVQNLAVSGRTTQNAIDDGATLDALSISGTKKILLCGLGSVECISPGPTTALANLKTWYAARQTGRPSTYTDVVQVGILPYGSTAQGNNRRAFNTTIQNDWVNWVDPAKGVTHFVDCAKYSELTDQNNTTYFTNGLSPAAAGNQKLAQAIFEHLESGGHFLYSPKTYSVFQRNTYDSGTGISTGPIMVTGYAFGPSPQILQGRFNGGNWTDVTTQSGGELLISGAFTGYINACEASFDNGRGAFETRWKNNGNLTSGIQSIPKVGVGDVWLIGGQSNSVTRTDASIPFTPPRALPSDYVSFYAPSSVIVASAGPEGTSVYPYTIGTYSWSDYNAASGNDMWYIYAANAIVAYTGLPIGLVRIGCSGVALSEWQQTRSLSDLTDLNSNARRRNIDTGGGGLLLFHQGEADAGQTQAYYESAVGTFLSTWCATALTDTGRNTIMVQNTLSEGVSHTYTQHYAGPGATQNPDYILTGGGNPSTNPSNAIRNRWPNGGNPLARYHMGADLNNSSDPHYVKLPDTNGQSSTDFAYTGSLAGIGFLGIITNAQDPIHMKNYNGKALIAGNGVAAALLTPAPGDTLPICETFFTK